MAISPEFSMAISPEYSMAIFIEFSMAISPEFSMAISPEFSMAISTEYSMAISPEYSIIGAGILNKINFQTTIITIPAHNPSFFISSTDNVVSVFRTQFFYNTTIKYTQTPL
jgi:hypothetical protein